MSAPPPKLNLTADDVRGAPEWVEPLLAKLNSFSGPVSDGFENGLTFRENFAGQIVTLDVTAPENVFRVTLENGWEVFPGAPQFGTFPAVRCSETSECSGRGLIRRTTPPAMGSAVFQSPLDLRPAADGARRLIMEAGNAVGGMEVLNNGTITYTFGPTGIIDLGNLRWIAAKGPPRWKKPITVTLGQPGKPFPGLPGYVLPLLSERLDGRESNAMATGVDWTILTGDPKTAGTSIRIHRIPGIPPGIPYRVTLLVLSE